MVLVCVSPGARRGQFRSVSETAQRRTLGWSVCHAGPRALTPGRYAPETIHGKRPTARLVRCPPKIIFVRFNQFVRLTERIATIAAPAVTGWVVGHTGTYRIQFNIAVAGEQIVVSLHQTGMIPAFPQRAAAAVGMVDIADIAPAERLHHLTDPGHGGWCQQQMDVVGHQDIGMYRNMIFSGGFAEALQVEVVIVISVETRLAIIATLDDVLRYGR